MRKVAGVSILICDNEFMIYVFFDSKHFCKVLEMCYVNVFLHYITKENCYINANNRFNGPCGIVSVEQ